MPRTATTLNVLEDIERTYNTSKKRIKFIYTQLGYPSNHDLGWLNGRKQDLFRQLPRKQLSRLQKHKRCYFIFDVSLEGYSNNHHAFFKSLYSSARKFQIPNRKIIYITSNHYDKNFHDDFVKKYNIQETIKIVTVIEFALASTATWRNSRNKTNIDGTINNFVNTHTDKIFLSLSRRSRQERVYLHYLLWNKGVADRGLISQARVDPDGGRIGEIMHVLKGFGVSDEKSIENFCKVLPLTADTNDFSINYANYQNKELADQVMFEIVGETLQNDMNKTSLFYSEKTFKPMLNMCPFLVWGQPHINKTLEEHGFKLYTKLFDYSFDSIEDTVERAHAIADQVKELSAKLSTMTPEQKLEGRFLEKETLEHNFDAVLSYQQRYCKPIFKNLIKQILEEV